MSAYAVVDGAVDGFIQLVKPQIAGQVWLNLRPAVEHQQSVGPDLSQAVERLLLKLHPVGLQLSHWLISHH